MFHSRKLNNHINQLNKQALINLYKDRKHIYEELLQKDRFVRVHHRKLQILVTEIFKVKNDLAPKTMTEVFQFRERFYNLRSGISTFMTRKVRITYFDLNSVTYFTPRIWRQIPKWQRLQDVNFH